MTAALSFNRPDRIPFVPAIYEHKARLLGRWPSQVCRSAELLHQACKEEVATYDADMLVVGMDVYNVEAEAMGWFDSRATPALTSPRIFSDLIAPVYREIVMPALKQAGAWHIPLIIGGDTTSVLSSLIATAATQLLCDFSAGLPTFLARCAESRLPVRANVDSRLVAGGTGEEMIQVSCLDVELFPTIVTQPESFS